MSLRSLALLVSALAALPAAFGQAAVEGRVALPKAPAAPVANKRYTILSYGGTLAPFPPVAVVYLEGAFPRPPPAEARQMAQRNLEFVPTLLAVQTGTRVEFPNDDDTYHNIFSYSAAKRFDLGRYRSDERPIPSVVFDAAGLVTLRCDIHEHMRALILVVDTPYFATSEADGRFRLGGLPEGRFTLKAWIDSRTTREQPVELKAGSTVRADFP